MGTSLCFDPRSIMCISKSLKVLNISDNGIESLSGLMPLRHLTSLCASNNRLKDIEETCELLKFWFYLKNAWFQGNPISKKHRYREDIIASSYCLDFLDDKPVSPSSRNFIKCLENNKLKKSSRPSIDLTQIVASAPDNYPPPLKNAVSASLIHSQLHIFGPLDVHIKNPISIVRGKPRLKKKPPHNRLNKEDSHSFPALFAYGMGSAWK
ncbi:protein phosphatase 1 regulatory subunit 42-like isoform X2 [Harmonia axyridis]|nr:protein phosphatase 1 regulatory subunit 42-like isoform X2 [Harmonia axyridis]